MGKKQKTTLKMTAAVIGAGAAGKMIWDSRKKAQKRQKIQRMEQDLKRRDYTGCQAYFIGGGIASMAGAAYLIRDCRFPASQITIYEGLPVFGGSNDGTGSPKDGFICRGSWMLNEETYENFWELFRSIPALDKPTRSVTEEILNFAHAHPTHARARLVDQYGNILDAKQMGFDHSDRMALLQLMRTDEKKLDDLTIEDWFAHTPHFFQTNFWYLWQTTFAFQKWSSLFEFRRYMERMIFEFSRMDTLESVARTPLNQYDSVIRPLGIYLKDQGVRMIRNCTVTDIDFADGDGITVQKLYLKEDGVDKTVEVKSIDFCFMTTACMTDCATLGDLHTPAPDPVLKPISGELWAKIAAKKSALGNPKPFFGNVKETNWESFTVTCHGNKLLKKIEEFTGNIPGSGALMTFKDSSWLLSSVVAAQPHFRNQPLDQTIFWGYGLHTDVLGDYVKKTMKECTGEEILTEYLHHLQIAEPEIKELMKDVVNVIPCYMPYIDAQFQPRKRKDRPQVIPQGSTNLAMIGQFVEIPEDIVLTEEYSVRSARMAVYGLLGIDREICPVTPWKKDLKVLLKAVQTAFR